MKLEQELEQLILYGTLLDPARDPLDILRSGAQEMPDFLVKTILKSVERDSPMVIPGVAALLCAANPALFHPKLNEQIFALLLDYTATDLLLLTEIVRSKVFGRGLGSRNQKLIRRVLEAWTETDLKENIILDNKAVYALVRLIHPRFNDRRSLIVKDLLN